MHGRNIFKAKLSIKNISKVHSEGLLWCGGLYIFFEFVNLDGFQHCIFFLRVHLNRVDYCDTDACRLSRSRRLFVAAEEVLDLQEMKSQLFMAMFSYETHVCLSHIWRERGIIPDSPWASTLPPQETYCGEFPHSPTELPGFEHF